MAKTNLNDTIVTGGVAQDIIDEHAGRVSFFFKSLGDVFMVDFGEDATADKSLTINANESIFLTNNDPFDIRKRISVFCANTSSGFEAQIEQ